MADIHSTISPIKRLGLLGCLVVSTLLLSAQNSTTFRSITSANTAESRNYHIVQRGENLTMIARKYNMNVSELARLNRLRDDRIYSGQTLIVAKKSSSARDTGDHRRVASNIAMADEGFTRGMEATGTPIAAETSVMLSSDPAPNAEDVWMRNHLRMLNPDGQSAPIIEQSYVERQNRMRQHDSYAYTTPTYTRSQSPDYQSSGRRTSQSSTTRGMGETRANTGSATRRVAEPGTGRIYHDVQPGETIYDIAKRYSVQVEQIRRWNGTRSVYPGQAIRIELSEALQGSRSGTTTDVELAEVEGILSGSTPALQSGTSGSTPSSTQPADTDGSNFRGSNQRTAQAAGTSHTYAVFSKSNPSTQFYALHDSHPIGSTITIAIPGDAGTLDLKVIDRLNGGSSVEYGFSPLVAELLDAAGAQGRVTVLDVPQQWVEP